MTGPAEADSQWMELAIAQSRLCPPSQSAYSVGAVIVGADGRELARGYSRETDPHVHAEEAALARLSAGAAQPPGPARASEPNGADGPDRARGPEGTAGLAGATIYSTLEPCSQRRSRPRSCTELILAAGIGRVVIAWREPDLFVADARGCELLAEAGVVVTELPGFAAAARAVNAHLRLDS